MPRSMTQYGATAALCAALFACSDRERPPAESAPRGAAQPVAPEPAGIRAATTAGALPAPAALFEPASRAQLRPVHEVSVAEPGAAAWRTVLLAVDAAPVSPPPDGSADEADRSATQEIRARDAATWERTARWWSAGGVRRWNELARSLLLRHPQSAGYASRALAALSVAQLDAAIAARRAAARWNVERFDPDRLAVHGAGHVERYGYPAEAAAIARASSVVLADLFPEERLFLEQNELADVESRVWSGAHRASDVEAGRSLGDAAGRAVVERLRSDGAAAARFGPAVVRQPDRWYFASQLLPGWGAVRPWAMRSGDQFRAPAPPDVHSSEFAAALAEIRGFSDGLSAEQLALAQYWNPGDGTRTVPDLWNELALAAFADRGWSEARLARAMALLNMALHDAGIACWESKFHYLTPRPSMRDSGIREPLGLPNMPSYTSGHSAFSGAAATILAHLLPERAAEFARLAEEASASRWYAGIHYRFDGDAGLEQGRQVADWVIAERDPETGAKP